MAEQTSALFPPQACIAVSAYSGELGRHRQTTMHKFDAETRGESAKHALSLSLPRLLTATCSHATTTVGYTKTCERREDGGDRWGDFGFLKHFRGLLNCSSQGVQVPLADGSSGSPKFPPCGTQLSAFACRPQVPLTTFLLEVSGAFATFRRTSRSRHDFRQRQQAKIPITASGYRALKTTQKTRPVPLSHAL